MFFSSKKLVKRGEERTYPSNKFSPAVSSIIKDVKPKQSKFDGSQNGYAKIAQPDGKNGNVISEEMYVDSNAYSEHSPEFKSELRKLTQNWNNMVKPNLTKVKGKINRLPTIQVKLNNEVETNALVDTGASCNIISKHLYDILLKTGKVIEVKKFNNNLLAANGSNIEVLNECTMKIKILNFSWKITLLVVKNISFDVILGADFVRQHQLILDLGNNCCYFKFKPDVKVTVSMEQELKDSVNNVHIGCSEMKKEIDRLIEKYPKVFTSEIGQALDLEVDLKVIDPSPVNIRPYFLSPPKLKKVKEIIDEWLAQDIIESSASPYSSPAFLTSKDRLVVNYTELNKRIEKVNFPIGDLQNYYQHLQGAKYYTVIDLNKSFLQCPLSEKSRPLTAFSTIFAKYQFKRVPFGLQIGSSVLSQYLDKVLSDVKFEFVLNFCDDIIIYSKDKISHLEHVKEIVKRLSDHQLTVNVRKAKFFCEEISFLGNIVKQDSVTIDPERTTNVRNVKPPRNVKDVMKFLGMIGFFAKYIKNYAEICEPLFRLKRKNVKFVWSAECQSAFETLKDCITNPPVLQLANFDKPFVLMTDSSDIAAGGCLMQRNDIGELLPIAYYSKKFTDCERRYSTYEKEAYAVILCMNKWHEFLQVQPFCLYTDNRALSYVLDSKKKVGRLSRWIERLLDLPYSVEHIKSEKNNVADTLSRLFQEENVSKPIVTEPENDNPVTHVVNIKNDHVHNIGYAEEQQFVNFIAEIPLAVKDLKYHQNEDDECKRIIASIVNKTNNLSYCLKNDILMYRGSKGNAKIYLPDRLFNVVFQFYHNCIIGGHLGIARTQAKVAEYFYRPNLNVSVKEAVSKCKICCMSKSMQRKFEGELVSAPLNAAMECIFVDLIGPLPRSKLGNQYILVVVDGMTRYVWLSAIKNCTSKLVINKLEQIVFNNFGVAKILVSDNASYFVSKEFKSFLFKNYVTHRTIAAYRACSNRAERHIRDVTTLLRCYYHDQQTMWDTELGYIQTSLNTAKNSSTKYSAFNLMFNHDCNNCLSNLWNIYDLTSDRLSLDVRKGNLSRAILNVKNSVHLNRKRSKYQHPKCRHPFKVGSEVYIKTHYLSRKVKQFSKKLALRYVGVYKIIYFLSPVTVLVQNPVQLADIRKVHIVDLKMSK